MSKTKHTPGPWNNLTPTTTLAIEIRKRLGKHNNPAKPVVDVVEDVVKSHDDLLAACRDVRSTIHGFGSLDREKNLLDAIIAKATE